MISPSDSQLFDEPACLTVTYSLLTPHHSTNGGCGNSEMSPSPVPHSTASADVVSPKDEPAHNSKLPSHLAFFCLSSRLYTATHPIDVPGATCTETQLSLLLLVEHKVDRTPSITFCAGYWADSRLLICAFSNAAGVREASGGALGGAIGGRGGAGSGEVGGGSDGGG